jgi:predicted ribosomally synthesized peptide with nif11-like leader
MSIEAVHSFFEELKTNQELQIELAKALESDNDREEVTKLANANSYNFTPDELWAEVQKRQAEALKRQESGELSDEELEAVAGGEFIVGATIITIAITASATTAAGGLVAWGVANNPNTKW